MWPILIKIGPFSLHTYGFLTAIGFLLAVILAVREADKEGIGKKEIIDLSFLIIISALIFARLFFIISRPSFLKEPLVYLWEGGLVFYGGLVGGVLAIFLYAKLKKYSLKKLLDIIAPSLAVGHFFGRLGCLAAGCCYGKPTNIFWGITFNNPQSSAPLGEALHPTQLYEAGANLLIFAFLLLIRKKRKFEGQIALLYLISYSFLRLIIEFFRGDEIRGFILKDWLSISQGIGLVVLIGAIISYFQLVPKRNN